MDNKKWTVYAHVNKVNGKAYIGITSTTLKARWGKNGNGYFIKNADGTYQHKKFAPALLKYGWNGFDHIVLATQLTKAEACEAEQSLIEKWDAIDNGYNVLRGGEINRSGLKASDETRKKMSKALSGENNPMYGRRYTDEERQLLSERRKGRKLSAETIRKISESHVGKKHSAETLEKMSLVRKGKKPVICLDTGKVYASIREAERETGVDHSQISAVCFGKPKYKTAGGFRWAFKGG